MLEYALMGVRIMINEELKKLERKIGFKGLLKRFVIYLSIALFLELLFNNAFLLGVALAFFGWRSSKFLKESQNKDIVVYRNKYIFDYLNKCENKMDITMEQKIVEKTDKVIKKIEILFRTVIILLMLIAFVVTDDLIPSNYWSLLFPFIVSASYTLVTNKIECLLLKKEIFSKILLKKE